MVVAPGKVNLSTACDAADVALLDQFCSLIHRTRAEVLRGLLYALLREKQDIFEQWRKVWTTKVPYRS
jgi:hypothetical protein